MTGWTVTFRHGGELSGTEAAIAAADDCEPFAYSQAFINTYDQLASVEITWDSREPGATERAEQIAAMICACPDMLKALIDLTAAFVNPGDGAPFESGEVPELDRARAAIAAAKP